MKKVISIMLALLLAVPLCVPVLAAEMDAAEIEDGDGFYIEEMPEYGQVDEIFFPEEEAPAAEPASEPAEEPGSSREDEPPQTEAVSENTPEAGERGEVAFPTPEPAPASSVHNYFPVIAIAAVLAAIVIAAVIVKKRRSAQSGNGQNDIGGRT